MLVKHLYKVTKSKNKEVLWFCYGEIIYSNLEGKSKLAKYKKEFSITKEKQCCDCGEWFYVPIKANNTIRCPECQKAARKASDRKRKVKSQV